MVWISGAMFDFNGMSNHLGFLYQEVKELHSLYIYVYIFCVVVS